MNELLSLRIKKIIYGYDKKHRKNIDEKFNQIVRTKLDITSHKPSASAGAIIYLALKETKEDIDARRVVNFIRRMDYSLTRTTLYQAIIHIRKNLRGVENGNERK